MNLVPGKGPEKSTNWLRCSQRTSPCTSVLFGPALAVFLLLQSFEVGSGEAEMWIFFECIMVTLRLSGRECV